MMGSSYLDSKNDFSVFTRLAELTFGFIFEPWWSPSIQILTFQKKKKTKILPHAMSTMV